MLQLSLISAALAALESLSVDTFDAFIASNDRVLVKFFAPWCGHCKSMAADYESAATKLEGKVALAEVDATIHSDLSSKYDVKGFPTLKYFNKGIMTEYDGGRKLNDFLSWADEITSPPVSTETPPEPTIKPIIVLRAQELHADFESYAEHNRKAGKFYHVASDDNKITHQHPNEGVNELSTLNKESIEAFLKKHKLPLVGEINGETFASYSAGDKGLVWCLFAMDEGQLAEVVKQNVALMLGIEKEVHDTFFVTYTNTHEFAQAIDGMLGITAKDFPAFVVQKKAGSKQKFVYSGDVEASKIAAFIHDVHAGRIAEAQGKSEPIPESQDEDVVKIVGVNFEETVFLADKDVLLEVYAPWCGHCTKLKPEYEQLAAKVAKDASDFVVIAKMDGTANEVSEDIIQVPAYPTIVFIKAGTKEAIKYEGARDYSGMWTYIKENSSHKDKILAGLNAKYDSEDQHDEL